jgi:predicted RNA-binding Zn-ribbon protein involved in translation (DUF1610 family)
MSIHNCPLCDQEFIPNDGETAVDYLSRGIIESYVEMQKKENNDDFAVCPRCGVEQMIAGIARNAMSRHIDCHVCSVCGTDEAVRVYADNIMPLSQWWICKIILGDYNG